MVSGVHYVGSVQPLTTSLTRLIFGGTLLFASPPTSILGDARPFHFIGTDAAGEHHIVQFPAVMLILDLAMAFRPKFLALGMP
jgi:hypothetical protein